MINYYSTTIKQFGRATLESRLIRAAITLLIPVALTLAILISIPKESREQLLPLAIGLTVAVTTLLLAAASMLPYLRSGSTSTSDTTLTATLSHLHNRLNAAEQLINKHSPRTYDHGHSELTEEIKQHLQATASQQLLDEIELRYGEKSLAEQKTGLALDIYKTSSERIEKEINSLAQRGMENLFAGIITAGLGLTFLGIFALTPPNATGASDLAAFYLPKVALAILTQALGFFFLKLYKTSLDDIKYFQNELTSLDSKIMAVMTAITLSSECLPKLLEELGRTDRNAVPANGNTLANNSSPQADSIQIKELLEKLIDVLQNRLSRPE